MLDSRGPLRLRPRSPSDRLSAACCRLVVGVDNAYVMTGRLAVLITLVGVSGGYAAVASGSTGHVQRSRSFISLWQPRGPTPSGRVWLEAFSLRSARPIARLAIEPNAVANAMPHPDRSGNIWITDSSGPQCTSDRQGCGPRPDSCSSTVTQLDPVTGSSRTVASFPDWQHVGDATPGPRRGVMVLMTGLCTRSFFDEHF